MPCPSHLGDGPPGSAWVGEESTWVTMVGLASRLTTPSEEGQTFWEVSPWCLSLLPSLPQSPSYTCCSFNTCYLASLVPGLSSPLEPGQGAGDDVGRLVS